MHVCALLFPARHLIPNHLVPGLARQYDAESKSCTFKAWSHVVSLIYRPSQPKVRSTTQRLRKGRNPTGPSPADQLFHGGGSRFPLHVPVHDRTWPIEDEPPTADVRQHSTFGFFAKPLEAWSASFVPNYLSQSFRCHQLIQFGERGRHNGSGI